MPRGVKPTGKPAGRPKNPELKEGYGVVYIAKPVHKAYRLLAVENDTTLREQIEKVLKDHLAKVGRPIK